MAGTRVQFHALTMKKPPPKNLHIFPPSTFLHVGNEEKLIKFHLNMNFHISTSNFLHDVGIEKNLTL